MWAASMVVLSQRQMMNGRAPRLGAPARDSPLFYFVSVRNPLRAGARQSPRTRPLISSHSSLNWRKLREATFIARSGRLSASRRARAHCRR